MSHVETVVVVVVAAVLVLCAEGAVALVSIRAVTAARLVL